MKSLLLFALLFNLFVIHSFALEKQDNNIGYGLMVDAGSGGTRIYIFKWGEDIPLHLEPIDANYSFSSKPGITTSISTQKEMDDYFEPFLQFAESKIPSYRYLTTPLFFKATAGLRMMSKEDADSVLAKVSVTLTNSKFTFMSGVVISGIEEGLFNWLTINSIHSKLLAPHSQTHGSLDLGLSSTQISFAPINVESMRSSVISLHLYNRTYKIYDRSFLGFGINEARKRMERTLAQSDSGLIVNPCLPKGYSRKAPWKAVMDGSSNYTGCMFYSLQLLKKQDCAFNCSIAGVFQPPIPRGMIFNARDHYARVVNFLQLPFDTSIFEINQKAKEICSLDYNKYTSRYNKEPEDYCFEASYIVTLLRDGFGFPENDSQIHFHDQINGMDTSWTLGAMYYEIEKFFYSLPSEENNLVDSFVATVAAISFGVVLTLVLLARKLSSQLKIPKEKQK